MKLKHVLLHNGKYPFEVNSSFFFAIVFLKVLLRYEGCTKKKKEKRIRIVPELYRDSFNYISN